MHKSTRDTGHRATRKVSLPLGNSFEGWSSGINWTLVTDSTEVDVEAGSLPWVTSYVDPTTLLTHDAMYRREAQPRSLAFILGSEKGLKEMRLGDRIHTASGVTDRQQDIGSRLITGP